MASVGQFGSETRRVFPFGIERSRTGAGRLRATANESSLSPSVLLFSFSPLFFLRRRKPTTDTSHGVICFVNKNTLFFRCGLCAIDFQRGTLTYSFIRGIHWHPLCGKSNAADSFTFVSGCFSKRFFATNRFIKLIQLNTSCTVLV